MLALSCEHGTQDDISNILQQMKLRKIRYTTCTFNTLLNHCVQEDHVHKAQVVLKKMGEEDVYPDTFTYHTLLKLYVRQNDAAAVQKVSREILFNNQLSTVSLRSLPRIDIGRDAEERHQCHLGHQVHPAAHATTPQHTASH